MPLGHLPAPPYPFPYGATPGPAGPPGPNLGHAEFTLGAPVAIPGDLAPHDVGVIPFTAIAGPPSVVQIGATFRISNSGTLAAVISVLLRDLFGHVVAIPATVPPGESLLVPYIGNFTVLVLSPSPFWAAVSSDQAVTLDSLTASVREVGP